MYILKYIKIYIQNVQTSSAIKQPLETFRSSDLCYKDVHWLHLRCYMDEHKRAVVDAFRPLRTIFTYFIFMYI